MGNGAGTGGLDLKGTSVFLTASGVHLFRGEPFKTAGLVVRGQKVEGIADQVQIHTFCVPLGQQRDGF